MSDYQTTEECFHSSVLNRVKSSLNFFSSLLSSIIHIIKNLKKEELDKSCDEGERENQTGKVKTTLKSLEDVGKPVFFSFTAF